MTHKLTPEIRKHILLLTETLPKVPFFQTDQNGKIFIPKVLKGERLNSKIVGDKISYQVQTSRHVRMVNHKVNLTNAFNKNGLVGIEAYEHSVHELNNFIENEKKKEAEVKE